MRLPTFYCVFFLNLLLVLYVSLCYTSTIDVSVQLFCCFGRVPYVKYYGCIYEYGIHIPHSIRLCSLHPWENRVLRISR